jgi:peptidyl-tRNA hydrolase
VGRPDAGPVPASWVLAVPPPEEAERLAAAERRAADAVDIIVTLGAAHAMNRINQREASHGGSPL